MQNNKSLRSRRILLKFIAEILALKKNILEMNPLAGTLSLQDTYSSYEDNLGEQFYSPVWLSARAMTVPQHIFLPRPLSIAPRVLRALRKVGIPCALLYPQKSIRKIICRLQQLQEGYVLRVVIREGLVSGRRETLSLEEKQNISKLVR